MRRLLLAVPLALRCVGAPSIEGTCSAHGGCSSGNVRRHPWPYARGPQGLYGVTNHTVPRDLGAALAWRWHSPKHRFSTVLNGGIVIDYEGNLYTAAVDGLVKLGPDGKLLWSRPGGHSCGLVLEGDTLYGDGKDGTFFALDFDGQVIWSTKVANAGGADCHSVGVSEGVMLSSTEGFTNGGNTIVEAVNASTGARLWSFKPSSQLWNFMPMFTGNGSVVFQDQIGGLYHLSLSNGKMLWHSGVKGGWDEFWTDGMSWLGPNGIVYAVHVHGPAHPLRPSDLRAYRLDDGELLWRKDFPYPVNSQPVVGQLREGGNLSVVMNSGQQAGVPFALFPILGGTFGAVVGTFMALASCVVCRCRKKKLWRRTSCALWVLPPLCLSSYAAYKVWDNPRMPSEVQALDANTGELQWRYEFPVWTWSHVRGDGEGLLPRMIFGGQPFCVPNGWGSPMVDASGTTFLGHQNGLIYAIRDDDGDGHIAESEVSTFDMGASSTHFGGAVGSGLLVWASCDSVFAFKLQ